MSNKKVGVPHFLRFDADKAWGEQRNLPFLALLFRERFSLTISY